MMDICFSTNVGGGAWTLAECGAWARENYFDAIRPHVNGVEGETRDSIREALEPHGTYLAALTAHNNLLDDDPAEREAAQQRLIGAIETASRLDVPVVVTHVGSPVGHHFYGMFSYPPGNPGDRSLELVDRFKEMYDPVMAVAEDRG